MSRDPRRYNEQFRPEFSRLHSDRDLRWVVPLSVRYVVAVTGERFAGKSAALAYLAERKGFRVYSLADTLREIAVRLGVPREPRYRLQDLGDELRAHFEDPAYLARLALRRVHRDHLDDRGTIDPLRRIAVGGFKRVEELELFERVDRFQHLRVEADRQIRFERAVGSEVMQRELAYLDPVPDPSLEVFEEYIDKRDLHGDRNRWTAGFGQGVNDLTTASGAEPIKNRKSLAELYDRLDQEVATLDRRFRAFSG
jgi:dephospho-CoA kinase